MGTSLQVEPVCHLANYVRRDIPRILINREVVGNFSYKSDRDVIHISDCDDGVLHLANLLGWKDELLSLVSSQQREKISHENHDTGLNISNDDDDILLGIKSMTIASLTNDIDSNEVMDATSTESSIMNKETATLESEMGEGSNNVTTSNDVSTLDVTSAEDLIHVVANINISRDEGKLDF